MSSPSSHVCAVEIIHRTTTTTGALSNAVSVSAMLAPKSASCFLGCCNLGTEVGGSLVDLLKLG